MLTKISQYVEPNNRQLRNNALGRCGIVAEEYKYSWHDSNNLAS